MGKNQTVSDVCKSHLRANFILPLLVEEIEAEILALPQNDAAYPLRVMWNEENLVRIVAISYINYITLRYLRKHHPNHLSIGLFAGYVLFDELGKG